MRLGGAAKCTDDSLSCAMPFSNISCNTVRYSTAQNSTAHQYSSEYGRGCKVNIVTRQRCAQSVESTVGTLQTESSLWCRFTVLIRLNSKQTVQCSIKVRTYSMPHARALQTAKRRNPGTLQAAVVPADPPTVQATSFTSKHPHAFEYVLRVELIRSICFLCVTARAVVVLYAQEEEGASQCSYHGSSS